MNKVKYSIFALLMAVGTTQATINVTWNWDESASTGIYLPDGITLAPAGTIVQIIFTTDPAVGDVNIGDPLSIPLGDTLISQSTTTADGFYTFGSANYGGIGVFVGGFVYQRVFTASLDAYGVGTRVYGASPANTATAEGSTVFAFLYDSAVDSQYQNEYIVGRIAPELVQTAPEPSTVALLGFGGLVLAIRRRFVA